MTSQHKANTLPLWRHHQQVVLPVVFIYADGCFAGSSVRSTPDSEHQPEQQNNFDTESDNISDIARAAHERLLADTSAVDVVQYVLAEFSKCNGRWPCKRESEFYQSSFMMDGDTKRSGAVGNYRSDIVHAVDAARHVLDKTEYNLLCGEGGRQYMESVMGNSVAPPAPSPEDNCVFDSTWPLSLYVIAADRNGSIACGSFDEQRTKDRSSVLKDSVLMGSGLYADSMIGSAITCNLNKTHKTSGLCLAWQTTQLMRDFAAAPQSSTGVTSSLSSYLSSQLRHYVDESTVVFALHKSGSLPTMKMSIFSFVSPQPDMRPLNKRKCAALSLVSGGEKFTSNHFYWSTILADLRFLSSSSLFDAHPYGSNQNLHALVKSDEPSIDESNWPIVILVHGGAGSGSVSAEYSAAYLRGVRVAVLAGYDCMAVGGKTAVQAVQEAVRIMENNPVFNAGCGSYLSRTGHVEMDAMLQDGANGRFGAVGAVKTVRNPIDLCARIMEDCNSDELIGGELVVCDAALDYAEKHGIEIIDEAKLICEKSKKAFEKWKMENPDDLSLKCGTVGAVAVDRFGNVASATSTGGLTGKIDGRIGDTPLPGCGTAADNKLGASSATGIGEHIMATCVSRACLHFIEKGKTAQQAAELAVEHLAANWLGSPGGGRGGVICVSPQVIESNDPTKDKLRRWGVAFNTEGMSWAAIDESAGKHPVLYSGLNPGQFDSEPVHNH